MHSSHPNGLLFQEVVVGNTIDVAALEVGDFEAASHI